MSTFLFYKVNINLFRETGKIKLKNVSHTAEDCIGICLIEVKYCYFILPLWQKKVK